MIKKILFTYIISLFATTSIQSQSTVIGQGAFASFNFGPFYSSQVSGSVSRFAYIYDESLLGSLQHGDSISSISFFKETIAGLAGQTLIKMYVRPTSKDDFGAGSLNWPNEIAGAGFRKVLDDSNFTMPIQRGFVSFNFATPYYWDTTFGKNFEILVEYINNSSQPGAVNWAYDNSGSQNGYSQNQSKFYINNNGVPPSDTLNNSEERKPMIRINYPRSNFEIGVSALYSLGKIPTPLGNPDTVKVLLFNGGKLDAINRKAYIFSKGANEYTDSLTFSLNRNTERLFAFPIKNTSNIGMDTLTVVLEPDGLASNDSIFGLREATEFTYSYRNLREGPAPGGIGFNGTTGDFVAKFLSSQPKSINQIGVTFGFGNQPFKLGIWDATGFNGTPGNLLWDSDTLLSIANFVMSVWPPVTVNGTFFVGVRQVGTNNIAFGYQNEDPVRNGTFFFTTPIGSSNWVDFAPGAPFRFLIEPRIQAENDVLPTSFDFPLDTLIFGTFDSIAPKATIRNIGALDQTTAFETKCNIRYFGGQLIYTSSVFDTLSSGQSRQVTFDSSFFPTASGEYYVEIITMLSNDQFKENDTLQYIIPAGKVNDVGPTNVFEPINNQTYQFNTDTVLPTVRIENFGFNNATFPVFALIYDEDSNIVWSETRVLNIAGVQSSTVGFMDFNPPKTGKYTFICYTRMTLDTFRNNDTVNRVFFVNKDNDVSVNFSIEPTNLKVYQSNPQTIFPSINIKNEGEKHQLTYFPAHCFIYKGGLLVFSDTTELQVFIGDSTTVVFPKGFTTNEDGNYRIVFVAALDDDQDRRNDTLELFFNIGFENDVEVLSIETPEADSILNLSQLYRPRALVRNNGFKDQFTPFNLTFQNLDSNGTIVQTIQKIITIATGDTELFEFDSIFIARPEGMIYTRVFAALPGDEVVTNDTAFANFVIEKTYDFEILERIPFNDNEQVLQNVEAYQPKVVIKNNSRIPTDSAFVSIIILNPNNTPVYNRVVKTNPTILGGIDTIDFIEYTPVEKGIYTVNVSVFSVTDQNPFNDSLQYTFESLLLYELRIATIPLPVFGDSLFKDENPSNNVIVRVVNDGQVLPDSAFLRVTLFDFDDISIKSDTQNLHLNIGESRNFTFVDFLKDVQLNTNPLYKLDAEVVYPQDQIINNNLLSTEFYLLATSSLQVISFGNALLAYPNPFENDIVIELKETTAYQVELYSADGKQVYSGTISENTSLFTVPTEVLPAGVYYLKLTNGIHIFAGKFIKI